MSPTIALKTLTSGFFEVLWRDPVKSGTTFSGTSQHAKVNARANDRTASESVEHRLQVLARHHRRLPWSSSPAASKVGGQLIVICRETVDWLQGINTMEGLPYGQLAFAHGLSERSTSAPCPVRPERLRVPGALLRPPVIGPHCALGMAHALRRLFDAVSVPKRKPWSRSRDPSYKVRKTCREATPHTLRACSSGQ